MINLKETNLTDIGGARGDPNLAPQQHEAVQEPAAVLVAEAAAGVAVGAEVEGGAAAVDAGEVERVQLRMALAAPHAARLHDVVERQDIPEVEPAVAFRVQLRELATQVHPPVAVPLDEVRELGQADSAVPVRVHGHEEVPR